MSKEIEDIAKRDTHEGLLAAQFQLRNQSQIQLAGDRLKISLDPSCEGTIFDALNPMVDIGTGQSRPRDQIVIVDRKNQKSFLYPEDKKFAQNIAKFVGKKGLSIRVYGSSEVRYKELVVLINKAGIPYNPETRAEITSKDVESILSRVAEQRMDRTILRLPAKITFNYFAWSLKKFGNLDVIYNEDYHPIRTFILEGTGPQPVAVAPDDELIFGSCTVPKMSPIHMMCWRNEDGKAIGEVSLFIIRRYLVDLGPTPLEFRERNEAVSARLIDLRTRVMHDVLMDADQTLPEESREPLFPWAIEIVRTEIVKPTKDTNSSSK
jgi:hypothetical protein